MQQLTTDTTPGVVVRTEIGLDREKATLMAALDTQREHVLGILDGLDDGTLHRSALPSGWTCAGMIGHLALDVERFWFGAVIGGDPAARGDTAVTAWQHGERLTATGLRDLYRDSIARADEVIATTALDASPVWWPESPGSWRLSDLREVLLHVITETACHAGHLDATRELIDGRLWLVLD